MLHLLTYTLCELYKGDRYTKVRDKETPDCINWHLCPSLNAGKWGKLEHSEICFTDMVRLNTCSGTM